MGKEADRCRRAGVDRRTKPWRMKRADRQTSFCEHFKHGTLPRPYPAWAPPTGPVVIIPVKYRVSLESQTGLPALSDYSVMTRLPDTELRPIRDTQYKYNPGLE